MRVVPWPLLLGVQADGTSKGKHRHLFPPAAHRPPPAVGGDSADQHALAAPHDAQLGGTQLRLRRRPRYAGHADGNGHAGTTATYVRADLSEIAAALTGEPHPLARMVAGPEATSASHGTE